MIKRCNIPLRQDILELAEGILELIFTLDFPDKIPDDHKVAGVTICQSGAEVELQLFSKVGSHVRSWSQFFITDIVSPQLLCCFDSEAGKPLEQLVDTGLSIGDHVIQVGQILFVSKGIKFSFNDIN